MENLTILQTVGLIIFVISVSLISFSFIVKGIIVLINKLKEQKEKRKKEFQEFFKKIDGEPLEDLETIDKEKEEIKKSDISFISNSEEILAKGIPTKLSIKNNEINNFIIPKGQTVTIELKKLSKDSISISDIDLKNVIKFEFSEKSKFKLVADNETDATLSFNITTPFVVILK